MADEQEIVDVNSAASSPDANSGAPVTPPAGENPAAEPQEHRIPKSRFDEVIAQRNAERERREQLEQAVLEMRNGRQSGSAAPSKLDALAGKLERELQMAPEAARKLAAIQLEAAEQVAVEKTQHLQKQVRAQEVDTWSAALARKYGDYNAVAPAMEKVFSTLPPETQDLVVSSPAGLEMLYSYAKSQTVDPKAVFDKGVDQAYKNKQVKQAISSAPGMGGAGGKAPLSKEVLARMPDKEFIERKAEIDAWVAEQSRRR
jgi:hypothetical protein